MKRAITAAPAPDRLPVDSLSWEQLVRRLLAQARVLGASAEDAEDLVHDTLERTVRDPSWYDPDRGPLLGLLHAVLRNQFVDGFRKRDVRNRAAVHLRLVGGEPSSADWGLACEQAIIRRQRFLESLTTDERRLFEVWLGQRRGALNATEAASALDLTVAQYEARKKVLRRRCVQILESLGMTVSDLFDPEPHGGV